ncbi:MAG: hypothetical protein R3E79_38940 [Caldilineaceae bacterium]
MRVNRLLTRTETKLVQSPKVENQQKQTPVQPVVQPAGVPGYMLGLQRQYGNRFVQRAVNLSLKGDKERRSTPEMTPCATGNLGQPDDEFICYFDSLVALYQGLFEKQETAVTILRDTAGRGDPPPFWLNLAVAGVSVALTAATGGIGTAVAIGVTNRLARAGIKDITIKIVSDMAKDGAKAAVNKIRNSAEQVIQDAAASYPETDKERSAKIFFDAQRRALIDAKVEAQLKNAVNKGRLRRSGKDGIQALKGLTAEIQEQYANAETRQRYESLMQWAVYQAKGVRGETKQKGTNLAKNRPGAFTPDRGVLQLEGRWLRGQALMLDRATMAGINAALRPDIARTPISKLKVPIIFRLEVGQELSFGEKYFNHREQPVVIIARDEQGNYWVRKTPASVALVIEAGGRPQETLGEAGRGWEVTEDQVRKAAQVVFDMLKVVTPPLK